MQYGAWNDAGVDQTYLWANPGGATLGVFGLGSADALWCVSVNRTAITAYATYPSYAGYFNGNVNVTGSFKKTGGGFLIDHPKAPEERYLEHSFVESSERLNVYSGIVTTDQNGSATVQMPSYFESLNRDFTYQLTVIGQFAQAIIEEGIQENRFVVRTNAPEVSVSWLVTGIRQDPWASANPMSVETDKPEEERGRYLHPEAHGQPRERGVDFEMEQLLEKTRSERRGATTDGDKS
jgi:hypothetical protein